MRLNPAHRITGQPGTADPTPSRRNPAGRDPRDSDNDMARQRRRRRRQLIERRRTLRTDVIIGFALAVTGLILAPGLGIVALMSIPVAIVLVTTAIVEQRRRRAPHPSSTARRTRSRRELP